MACVQAEEPLRKRLNEMVSLAEGMQCNLCIMLGFIQACLHSSAYLAMFTNHIAHMAYDNSSVPYCLPVRLIALKYRVDDDHVVFLSILLKHLGGWASLCRLSKF